jgi:hypothetical protein
MVWVTPWNNDDDDVDDDFPTPPLSMLSASLSDDADR